jgi:hypothetical protein
MEKRTPHCKLTMVKTLVEAGKVRTTHAARGGANELGFAFSDMLDVVMALTSADFYKSMTTHADHRGLGSNGTGNSDRCSSCPTTSSIIHCWITQGTQGAFCHGFRDRQRISSLHVDMVVDMRRQTGHVLNANVEPFFP